MAKKKNIVNRAGNNIPVIMISASPNISRESQVAGANDYIEKPFDIHDLLSLVKRNIYPSSKRLQIK